MTELKKPQSMAAQVSDLSKHYMAQQRERIDKVVHIQSLKKGLATGDVKKLPFDELNDDKFSSVLKKYQKIEMERMKGIDKDRSTRATSVINAKKMANLLEETGGDMESVKQSLRSGKQSGRNFSKRSGSTQRSDSVKLARLDMVDALETALQGISSPALDAYRNKYQRRMDQTKDGAKPDFDFELDSQNGVKTGTVDGVYQILSPQELQKYKEVPTQVANPYGKAEHYAKKKMSKYNLLRDFNPTLENLVFYDRVSNDFFGKKMFQNEEKTAARTCKIDLSMPQSNEKIDFDTSLGKDEVNRHIIDPSSKRILEVTDKEKIGNITRELHDQLDCFVDQQKVAQSIRKFTEPSAGDSIFHKDTKNQYLRKTFTDMDKNLSILNAEKAISRKKSIVDPGSPHVFQFPAENLDKDKKLADKVGPTGEKRFLLSPRVKAPKKNKQALAKTPVKVKLNPACLIIEDDPVAWADKESESGVTSAHTKYSMTVSKRSKLSSMASPSQFLDALSRRSNSNSKTSLPSIVSLREGSTTGIEKPKADDWLQPKKQIKTDEKSNRGLYHQLEDEDKISPRKARKADKRTLRILKNGFPLYHSKDLRLHKNTIQKHQDNKEKEQFPAPTAWQENSKKLMSIIKGADIKAHNFALNKFDEFIPAVGQGSPAWNPPKYDKKEN